MKWLSKHDNSVWDLWDRPTRRNKLIIHLLEKMLYVYGLTLEYLLLSLQGEGYIPKEHVVQQLKDRFEVYVLYDNDFPNSDINNGRYCHQLIYKTNRNTY